MRKANERRKRAGQRNSCGAILGSFHRTSLIFSLNVAQWIERGIVRPVLAILRSQTSSTGPVLKRQRTSTRSTALQNWNLSQSDTPALLPTLDPRPRWREGPRRRSRKTRIQPLLRQSTRDRSDLCSAGTSHEEAARRGGL